VTRAVFQEVVCVSIAGKPERLSEVEFVLLAKLLRVLCSFWRIIARVFDCCLRVFEAQTIEEKERLFVCY
jgi:hypothetical protein